MSETIEVAAWQVIQEVNIANGAKLTENDVMRLALQLGMILIELELPEVQIREVWLEEGGRGGSGMAPPDGTAEPTVPA